MNKKSENKTGTQTETEKMICVIRIRGRVGIRKNMEETLKRLRLGKKYTCTVIPSSKENMGMVKKVKDLIAFGEITPETYKKLKEKRGRKDSEGKLKPFFRLHPPRGGAKTKFHFPKGILGNNKDKINDLVERML